jgi:muramidase (phage lysozyme)
MSKPIHHATAVQIPVGVERAARAAASGTKTDFKALLASALSESRHDPQARNKRSSATGAFQFTKRTWLDLVRR